MPDRSKSLEDMTPEQRAAVAAIRAGRHTPEADAERERFREEIRKEVPPAAENPFRSPGLRSLYNEFVGDDPGRVAGFKRAQAEARSEMTEAARARVDEKIARVREQLRSTRRYA